MENRSIDMQEEWIKLDQYNIPEGQFIILSFEQNLEGTKIILNNETTTVEVFFDGIPLLSRGAVEGIRMRSWSEIQLKYQNKFIFRNNFFFEVKKSKLLQWVLEESCGFYEETELRHFCLVTGEELIDIVATFEPTVSINREKESTITAL